MNTVVTWIHSLPSLHLQWPLHGASLLHDASLSALAAAVAVLGVVILLELRSVVQLRTAVDSSLARVFEQLDLLRFENQQLLEAHCRQTDGSAAVTSVSSASLATTGTFAVEPLRSAPFAPLSAPPEQAAGTGSRPALAAGEARLLASLAEARLRRQGGSARL